MSPLKAVKAGKEHNDTRPVTQNRALTQNTLAIFKRDQLTVASCTAPAPRAGGRVCFHVATAGAGPRQKPAWGGGGVGFEHGRLDGDKFRSAGNLGHVASDTAHPQDMSVISLKDKDHASSSLCTGQGGGGLETSCMAPDCSVERWWVSGSGVPPDGAPSSGHHQRE